MNYPLISEYISSIMYAEDNLATRTSLRPVLDSTGNPIMSSGNFAVVFKMIDIQDNKHYAMKCFLRDQVGREESYLQICEELEFVDSRYLLKIAYHPDELFVDTSQTDETEFPVLLMEWVEGCTLGAYITDNYTDSFRISQLAYNFSKMATWLLSQDFAHGDIKPDNIIVKDDGNLVLVDYDGMFVPSMRGNLSRESGSPNFRHPERIDQVFDEHIDDFALAVLNLTLKVLSVNIGAISTILANDYCLFSENEYLDISNSVGLRYIESELNDFEVQKLWGVFLIALSDKKLSSVSFRLASISVPSKDGNYSKLTKSTDDEKKNQNERGFVLDRSGKRLIAAKTQSYTLDIPEGIEVICDAALQGANYRAIVLPDSVKAIGGIAFANNQHLQQINIPKDVVFIEHSNPFGGCLNLKGVRIDSSKYIIDDDCLYSFDHKILYSSLFADDNDVVKVNSNTSIISGNAFWRRSVEEIVIPQGLSVISGTGAFGFCENLKRINIPDSVVEIGDSTFIGCKSLENIFIPDSVKKMGRTGGVRKVRGMFQGCKSLTSVHLPRFIDYIGKKFFSRCIALKQVSIPEGVVEIGAWAFEGCESLESVTIPASVRSIQIQAFHGCKSLRTIYIPDTVVIFGETTQDSESSNLLNEDFLFGSIAFGKGMFSKCYMLENVRLPRCIKKINEEDFMRCSSLTQIVIPDSVTEIGKRGFFNCKNLSSIHLPIHLQSIHVGAFAGCRSLERVTIPDSLTSLNECSFMDCTTLKMINLPSKLTHLEGNPFPGCVNLTINSESDAFVVSNVALYSYNKNVLHSFFGDGVCDDNVFDGVRHIDRYCFSRSNIESISIPDSISTINDFAFSKCDNLKVAVLNGITEISSHLFADCTELSNVSIPSSVTIIREYAFYHCNSLIHIQLPASVTIIEDAAFNGCSSLSSIVLPGSIQDISHKSSPSGVFQYCKELSIIELNSYIPSLLEIDFHGCDKLSKIIVPVGDKKKYENKLGKYYSLIVEQYEGKDDLPF